MPIKVAERNKRKNIVTVAMTDEEVTAVDALAKQEDRTRSGLIQHLIRERMAKYKAGKI